MRVLKYNGEYKLFPAAQTQNTEQPGRAEASVKDRSESSVSVEISNEGWEKYCSSKAADEAAMADIMKSGCVLYDSPGLKVIGSPGHLSASNLIHRSLNSTFNWVVRGKSNDSEYELEMPAEDAAATLLEAYAIMYDDIIRGYAEGTRTVYDTDESQPEGYRILTKEEELKMLDDEFDNLVAGYLFRRDLHYKSMKTGLEMYQKLTIEFAGKRGRYAKWDEFYEKCKAKAEDLEERLKKNDMPDDFGVKVMKGLTMLKKSYVGVVNDNLIQKALDVCHLPAAQKEEE